MKHKLKQRYVLYIFYLYHCNRNFKFKILKFDYKRVLLLVTNHILLTVTVFMIVIFYLNLKYENRKKAKIKTNVKPFLRN